ncbi:CVNH domain-containing protein [Xylariales sp. PMI_506]|nr:CVNH domain-containing protein [Xylariales sp. PMI_506]
MVLRPLQNQPQDMSGYPSPNGPPQGYYYGQPGQQQYPQHPQQHHQGNPNQWQGYPPQQEGSPYSSHGTPLSAPPPHGSPYGGPPPQGSPYGGPPHGSPYGGPPSQGSPYGGPPPHGPPPGGRYDQPQPHYAGSSGPPPGYGRSPGHSPAPQGQSYYAPPGQHSPYQPPGQPQYAPHSPGYGAPQIKHEYSSPLPVGPRPPVPEDRGFMGALAGGAAGGFAGHKVNHGVLGAMAGAFAGHKLEDAYKDHKKPGKLSSRRSSSSSSSSSSSGHSHHHHHSHHNPPPPPMAQHNNLRGNFSLSSSRISLDNDLDLIAECSTIDGQRKLSSISLNRLLTNDDGHLRWAREGNFAASSRNVQLTRGGRFLEAELQAIDGSWRYNEICLDEMITNSNGNLQMV